MIPKKSSWYSHSFLPSKIQATFLKHNHTHYYLLFPTVGTSVRYGRQKHHRSGNGDSHWHGEEQHTDAGSPELSARFSVRPGPQGDREGAPAKVKSSSSTSRIAPDACVWPCIWKFFKYMQKYRELHKELHTYTTQIQYYQDLLYLLQVSYLFSFPF